MKKSQLRASVSILLLFCLIVLLITAIAIQVIDMMVSPEMLADLILNPEKQDSYFLAKLQSFITGTHVIVGFLFVGLSIIHIIKNWKTLRSYLIGDKNTK